MHSSSDDRMMKAIKAASSLPDHMVDLKLEINGQLTRLTYANDRCSHHATQYASTVSDTSHRRIWPTPASITGSTLDLSKLMAGEIGRAHV